MQQNFASGEACCFTGRPEAIDPMRVDGVVPAGDVGPAGRCESGGCGLASIYFPSQVYRAGYRPEEALDHGTLFPELVSPYPYGRKEC
ncbi:MAG: spore coat associated protein CotJA [Clostridia bacterium]|nr:spore coat associated protein CotJA [Clostridia bacterium]